MSDPMNDLLQQYREEDAEKIDAIRSELNISKRILAGRLDRGLTQHELAVAASTTQARIAELEALKCNARLDTLDRVAKALGLCVDLVPRASRPETAATAPAPPSVVSDPEEGYDQ